MSTTTEFVHRFVPATQEGSRTTLLLLHGTGGNENDLLPLGRALDPGAPVLSPRGKVSEGGMPRFFRRLAPGVFDLEDLVARTHELARFIEESAAHYGFAPDSVVAAGFSNGANIAGSLLLLHPGLLRGAILLSPMVPFEPDSPVDLAGTPVFIGAGRADAMVPAHDTERLATLLEESNAQVTVHWEDGGHSITPTEVGAAKRWLQGL